MPERGVLLWRIKKDFEKNMTAFAALLESSEAFGIRKTVLSKHGQPELTARVADLQTNNQRLLSELNHWKQQFETTDKRNVEQRSLAEKLHQEEVNMFRRVNQQLKVSYVYGKSYFVINIRFTAVFVHARISTESNRRHRKAKRCWCTRQIGLNFAKFEVT